MTSPPPPPPCVTHSLLLVFARMWCAVLLLVGVWVCGCMGVFVQPRKQLSQRPWPLFRSPSRWLVRRKPWPVKCVRRCQRDPC